MSIDWPNGAGPLPRFRELEAEIARLKAELEEARWLLHMWLREQEKENR